MELQTRRYGMLDILRIPFACAPVCTILLLLGTLLGGLSPMLTVLATGSFIDTALRLASGQAHMGEIVLPLALVAAITGYSWLRDKLMEFLNIRIRLQSRDRFRGALTRKRAKLNYWHIENSEDWDLIGRLCKEPEKRVQDALHGLMNLLTTVLGVAGILAILVVQVWWAALLIVAISVPLMLLASKMGKANYQADKDMTKVKRVYEYLSDVLTSREAVEERALFGYGDALNEQYAKEYEDARRYEVKVQAKWFIRSKGAGILFAVIVIAIIGILLQPTLAGLLSVGTFMALVNGVSGMINGLSWALPYALGEIAKGTEYYKDVGLLVDMDETDGALSEASLQPPAFESLVMRDVRFRYPGTERWVLDGVSLTIEAGKHYAFVGSNGAGKTTITRLLTGLYPDFEGEILLNGRDIRSYSQSELKSFYSVIYQDFARYPISVKDNVAFDYAARASLVAEAMESVGLTQAIGVLENGLDTPLGKLDEKGQDLSGGEWQRLAMARAIVNPAPLRILDEPTAALDPISESQVYTQFEEISRGITTLFISHRLGSTRLADTIYVLEDGRIAEQGSHAELMENDALYARMYDAQRSWYQ